MKHLPIILAAALICAAPLSAAGKEPATAGATRAITPEAEALLTPEALAAYSAPGNPDRYRPLIRRITTPDEQMGPPAKKLRAPLRSFPDGRPQTLFLAEEAWSTPDMLLLRGRRIRVEQFREDGTIEAVLLAKEAVVDRKAGLAVAKGIVDVTYNGDHLVGNGALIDLNARYIRVLDRAVITTPRIVGADFSDRGLF